MELKKLIETLDLDSYEHDYIINCLKEAVSYCKEQYDSSNGGIDVLSAASNIGLQNEADKFILLDMYLNTL